MRLGNFLFCLSAAAYSPNTCQRRTLLNDAHTHVRAMYLQQKGASPPCVAAVVVPPQREEPLYSKNSTFWPLHVSNLSARAAKIHQKPSHEGGNGGYHVTSAFSSIHTRHHQRPFCPCAPSSETRIYSTRGRDQRAAVKRNNESAGLTGGGGEA